MPAQNCLRCAVLSTWILSIQCQDLFLAMPEASPPLADDSVWSALRGLLKGWELTTEYAVTVGTASHGNVFTYQGGNFTLDTRIPTGSTSKWPSAMMFAGLVNDGTISSLDDAVSKYLTYWTKDPKDARSTITFRMLLSFTSGFGGGHPGEEGNSRASRAWRSSNNVPRNTLGLHARLATEIGEEAASPCNTTTGNVPDCARSIYENVKLIGKPGQVYSYNSNHLQLAAAVSMAASGLDIHQVIQKYLVKAFNMSHSLYTGKCPDFAGDLVTTGADYEHFLAGLLSYKALSKKIIDASEEDSTPFMRDYYTLYGNYGFGHFLMCFDSVDGMTPACREAKSHMDPGAYGFIPIIDRRYNYYLQIVAAEIAPTGSYPLSGIPEYLAVTIKDVVDKIMSTKSGETLAFEMQHHTPALLSMSVADVNYCVDCKLHPANCA